MRDQLHDAEMPRVGQRLHELLVESCKKGHDGEEVLRNEDADIQAGCGRGLRRVGVDIAEFGCAADDFRRISSLTPDFPASAFDTVTALTPSCRPMSRMVIPLMVE